jgi:hypothetical protein
MTKQENASLRAINAGAGVSMLNILGVLTCFAIGFTFGILWGNSRGIPFLQKKDFRWSIGIYTGASPFELSAPDNLENPVITAADIMDIPADFVADPFMIQENSTWYMFFEVMSRRGEIGLAQSSDGLHWDYRQIILREPFHLSYPYVFKWEDEYYMIPEASQTNSIRLYRADEFPLKWSFVSTLLEGRGFRDASVVFFQDRWWMFVALSCDVLLLYHAAALFGPWILHPQSPIIMGDYKRARPAGRIILRGDRIVRFAQDDSRHYGNSVLAFEISEITPTSYRERAIKEAPILRAGGSGWNARGMHHVDLHKVSDNQWIACVDGHRENLVFQLNANFLSPCTRRIHSIFSGRCWPRFS